MNNTSMTIWWLLFVYQGCTGSLPMPPILDLSMRGMRRSPRRHGGESLVKRKAGDVESTGRNSLAGEEAGFDLKISDINYPLILGSLHLSLMAGIGVWLWSNPSRLHTPTSDMGPCIPSYSILGSHIPLTSRSLRVVSLIVYGYLLCPYLNIFVALGFCTVLVMIITFDSHHDHAQLVPDVLKKLFPNKQAVLTAWLWGSLSFVFVLNVVFAIDIELMLSRNKHLQEAGEDTWGFGQVLALLMLAVPLYALFSSILRGKKRREKEQKALAKQEQKAPAEQEQKAPAEQEQQAPTQQEQNQPLAVE
jgi:hypothetical protein